MMLASVRILTPLLAAFFIQDAAAQKFLPEHYRSGREQMVEHRAFKYYHALPLWLNQGEQAGDSYDFIHYDVMRRARCFPGLPEPTVYPQVALDHRYNDEIDLTGKLDAEVLDFVKGEIEGQVRLTEVASMRFREMTLEAYDLYLLREHLDMDACPELVDLFQDYSARLNVCPIKGIFYGEGVITIDTTLDIQGTLSVKTLDVLKGLLAKLGFSGAVSGRTERINKLAMKYKKEVPVAFIPAFVSVSDVAEKENYIKKGGLAILENPDRSFEDNVDAFFARFPELKRDPMEEFTKMSEGALESFDPQKNSQHTDYVRFKNELMRAQMEVFIGDRL